MIESRHHPTTMIETDFFFLTTEQYQQTLQDAAVEGVSVDYYLMEFCDTECEWVEVKGP